MSRESHACGSSVPTPTGLAFLIRFDVHTFLEDGQTVKGGPDLRRPNTALNEIVCDGQRLVTNEIQSIKVLGVLSAAGIVSDNGRKRWIYVTLDEVLHECLESRFWASSRTKRRRNFDASAGNFSCVCECV